MTPCVKTAAAVDHDRHGTNTNGFGQFVAANEAICEWNQDIMKHTDSLKKWKLVWSFAYMATHWQTANAQRSQAVAFAKMEQNQVF